ncbi:MAG: transcriptional regulator [Rhodoblastus sp.]
MRNPVNVTARDKARRSWGDALPDWVDVLAEECDARSGVVVARRIGYSGAVVSSVLAAKYKGDLGKVEAKVRGALMGEIVQCPVLDEITKDRCIAEQGRKFAATSSTRAKLYRACRAGCAHSRLGQAFGVASVADISSDGKMQEVADVA